MAILNACPDTQRLLHLLRDPLGPEEAEAFASHLENCPACAGRLEVLEKEAPLLDVPPAQGSLLQPPPPHLAQMMAQLERLPEHLFPDQWAAEKKDTAPGQPSRGQSQPVPLALPGFEILELLGQGGMGVVYKARHKLLQRLVAVKTISAERAGRAEERARFLGEARAVARLHHPHIIQLHEIGEQDGQLYLVMEFAAGGTLAQHLGGQPQQPAEAASLVRVLAQAMHHAHQAGIIHRDLKPANVLLQSGASSQKTVASSQKAAEVPGPDLSPDSQLLTADSTPKITDFGLAMHIDDQRQTQAGQILGTPSYMAPEQAWGRFEAIGPATDVHALGAILYEMLTGRPPYLGANKWDTLEQVRHGEPLPPGQLQPKLPRDLETICLKCLRKEPQQRYATALDLADDLGRFLAGEPIVARPVGRLERLVKWSRRHPALTALAGVSVLALVSLLSAVGFYARYQAQQADISRKELLDLQHRDRVRTEVGRKVIYAQQHQADGRWVEARTELKSALAALQAHPGLDAEELQVEIGQRLVLVENQLRSQEEIKAEQARRDRFYKLRDDALFYQVLFTGLDVEGNRVRSQEAAQAALALFGLGGQPDSPLAAEACFLGKHLPPADKAELALSCYELLLLWAQLVATSPDGANEPALQPGQRAQRAMCLLDRARKLGQAHGVQSRLLELRQADYLAQNQGKSQPSLESYWLVPSKDLLALDWFLLGLQSYRAGRFDLVGQACAEVLRRQPRHFWAQYLQAMCHLRAGRWAEAKADLTICLHSRPDFAWSGALRGFASSELGFKSGPGSDLRAARADLDRALSLAQPDDLLLRYTILVNRGVLHIRQQQLPEAIADLRQATIVHPQGYQAYLNLAQAYLGMTERAQALALLDQAIAKVPRQALLYESRAKLHLAAKDYNQARSDLEQALKLEEQPAHLARLQLELASVLEKVAQFSQALAACDQALQHQPGLAVAFRRRAEILLALSRYDEAGRAMDEYLQRIGKPKAADYEARGLIHSRSRQHAAAVDMFTLALHLEPANDRPRCSRGWSYLLLDAPLLALGDFQACLDRDAGQADARCGRSWAQARLHKTEAALADALAVEKHGPLGERLHYKLACIYALLASQPEADKRLPLQATRRALCQDKAVHHLQQAIKQLPLSQQPAFWRHQVQNDPALSGLRNSPAFERLAKKYGAR